MSQIQPIPQQPLDVLPQFCAYCGAALDARFYFCARCAAPYQSPDAVVPVAIPMPLSESQRIRRRAPYVWPMFWTYLSVILGLGIAAHLFMDRSRPDLVMLLGSIVLGITTFIFGAIHWRSLVPQLKTVGFVSPLACAAVGILVPLLLLNWGYHSLMMYLMQIDRGAIREELLRAHFGTGTLVMLYCIIPAITEEIAFRGLLQHWLAAAIRPQRALLLASALFAAMHLSVISFPYLLLVGLLLGWAKWKTGSLYPSMAIHFLHNLVVVMCFWI